MFSERAWTKDARAGTPGNIQERVTLIAQAGYEAAQKVLDMECEEGITFEQALDAFTALRHELSLYITTGKASEALKGISTDDAYRMFIRFAEGAAACEEIKQMLAANKKDIDPQYMQDLRERISQVLDAHYHLDEKGAEFLQRLSVQINTQAEAMSVVQDIGKDVLEGCAGVALLEKGPVDCKEASELIETVISNYEADNWDDPINYIIWAFKNLARVILAWIDNNFSGFKYNSYAIGNANMWMGDFTIAGKNVRFNLGPSPMNDSLFSAQLAWEKKQGIHRLQHTLECPHPAGERRRLEELRDASKKENNHLSVMATPLDGDIWKGKENFERITSVADFHDKLLAELNMSSSQLPEQMEQHRGFANPILTQEEIAETIQASKEAFESLLPGPISGLDAQQNERLSKAMLLGFTGFLVVKTLLKLPEWIKNGNGGDAAQAVTDSVIATMGQVCKQGIDRGPIANATTLAFVTLIEKGMLNGQDVQQLTGMVLMRALMVDNRTIMKSRLEALLDLFNLIGENEAGFTRKLQSFAGKTTENPSPIRFIPSQVMVVRSAQEGYEAAQKVLDLKYDDRTFGEGIDAYGPEWSRRLSLFAIGSKRPAWLKDKTFSSVDAGRFIRSPEFKQIQTVAAACQEIKGMLSADIEDIKPLDVEALRKKIHQILPAALKLEGEKLFAVFLRQILERIDRV